MPSCPACMASQEHLVGHSMKPDAGLGGPSLVRSSKTRLMFLLAMKASRGTAIYGGITPQNTRYRAYTMREGSCLHSREHLACPLCERGHRMV